MTTETQQRLFVTEAEYDVDVADAFRSGCYTGIGVGLPLGVFLTLIGQFIYFFVY